MNGSRKKILIAVLACLLTLLVSTGITLAYFTDYETALGEVTIQLNGETQIDEDVTDTQKVVKIVNTGEAGVLVRVAIYGPDGMKITAEDEHWKKHGDFYYYDQILAPKESTGSLTADISDIPVTADMSQFDIIVNHESALVSYDENNNVNKPEGWDYVPAIKAQ